MEDKLYSCESDNNRKYLVPVIEFVSAWTRGKGKRNAIPPDLARMTILGWCVQLSCKEAHFLFPINHTDLTRVQHHPMGSMDEIC